MLLKFPRLNKQLIEKSKYEIYNFGYTVLKNAINKDFLNSIEKESLLISWGNIGKAEINTIQTLDKCTLSSSHNLVNFSSLFKELYNSKEIKDFFYNVLGEEPNCDVTINSSYFFKAKESKEIKLHQDNAYFNLISGINCLTFYVPIHYQSKNSGTIFYFRGSHLLGMLKHVPEGNLGASMCIDKNKSLKKLCHMKIDYPELYPGDIAVHNALVIHGTLPNPKNINCEALNFTLFGKKNHIDSIKYHKYKNLLKDFLKKETNLTE